MLTFPSALRIYLAVEPVDMRKSFNRLWSQAEQKLREDPRQSALFVFANKDPWSTRTKWRAIPGSHTTQTKQER